MEMQQALGDSQWIRIQAQIDDNEELDVVNNQIDALDLIFQSHLLGFLSKLIPNFIELVILQQVSSI